MVTVARYITIIKFNESSKVCIARTVTVDKKYAVFCSVKPRNFKTAHYTNSYEFLTKKN